jgi:G patch domain-containing protein 1
VEADGDGRPRAQEAARCIYWRIQCRVSFGAIFGRAQDFLTMLRYFNSVGSKEGWTPKTFVSSRSNRNKDQAATPAQHAEDFMDEEDLAEAAETRQLETAQNFAGIGGSDDTGNDGFFGLFMNQEETMGVKLAQKMGWRRDQGIGRKISRAARTEDATSSSKDIASYTFAPEDTRAMPIPREEVRRKGLGYQSEARLGVVEEKPAARGSLLEFHLTESSKKPPVVQRPTAKKSSFGVGVLNDTGSDDEEPYELGPKISFNKTIGKDKKAKRPSKFAKAATNEAPIFISKKTSLKALSLLNRASMDGKPPLTGFVLAADIAEPASKSKYPAPKIPTGWRSSKSASLNATTTGYQSVADAAKASTLDAKGRSALLGEKQLPGKSIFDFISKDARDRLANLSGRSDLPQGRGESGPEGHLPAAKAQPKDLWTLVPPLDKSTAAAALAKGATGWMPYAEDLQKRARYVGFLELRAELKEDLPERSGSITTSDWVKELQEFAHAAQVFKPTTGIMASRFTSASSTLGGSSGVSTEEFHVRQPAKKTEDPAEQAAKMGMYGAMTRTSFLFHPSRLLCKRFNVRPPPDMPHGAESEGDGGFKAKTEEAVSKSAMDKMLHEVLTNGPALQRPAWMGQAPQDSVPAAAPQVTEHATVDVEENEALSNERAPEDVFRSIFGDDDGDDNE